MWCSRSLVFLGLKPLPAPHHHMILNKRVGDEERSRACLGESLESRGARGDVVMALACAVTSTLLPWPRKRPIGGALVAAGRKLVRFVYETHRKVGARDKSGVAAAGGLSDARLAPPRCALAAFWLPLFALMTADQCLLRSSRVRFPRPSWRPPRILIGLHCRFETAEHLTFAHLELLPIVWRTDGPRVCDDGSLSALDGSLFLIDGSHESGSGFEHLLAELPLDCRMHLPQSRGALGGVRVLGFSRSRCCGGCVVRSLKCFRRFGADALARRAAH
jgi:hypothetical protein